MTVSTFLQPNFTTQDPTTYKGSIDGAFAVMMRIATQFAPYATSTDLKVSLLAGALYGSTTGTLTAVAAQQSTAIAAPSSAGATRIDRIAITKASGAVVVITGTPSTGAPAAPAYTSSLLPVAQVLLSTGTTAIDNSLITDERTLYVV